MIQYLKQTFKKVAGDMHNKISIKFTSFIMLHILCSFPLFAEQNLATPPAAASHSAQDSKDNGVRKVNLGRSVIRAEHKDETYQSSNTINSQILESAPSGNGDIGSMLRILPNVQFDNAELRSNTPGEIDPAKISISGGLHYQNLFTIDGRDMNNDLNPAQNGSTWTSTTPGRSQGMAIDVSLLESINVQDSNVSAAYGGFTGGVVEAFTRRANKPFGANISYQITQGNAQPGKFSMTHYHIYGNDASLDAFINASANGENQTNTPVFIKHLIRANLESQIDDKLGVIAAFATTQSFIPLRRSDNSYLNTTAYPIPEGIVQDSNGQAVQNQVRQIYNYFLKTHYDVDEDLSFELTYTYAPDYNNRYLPGGKPDQSYDWVSGGHDVGFKTTWRNTLGKMTNTLGYSYLQNSTIAHGYEHTKEWRVSDAKNWSNWAGRAREGGYAPSESIQHTLSNKLIQDFKPLQDSLGITHRFQVGFELGYQYARFGYTHDHFIVRQTTTKLEANQTCPNLEWCDPSKTYFIKTSGTGANRTYTLEPWENGQYFYSAWLYRGSTTLDNTLLAAFAEDDMALPLEYKGRDIGHINIRPGIRFDYDSYMDKLTTAPRLSLSYEAPWNELHHEFSTSMIAGANRYYGRNIFSYRLREDLNAMQTTIYRNDPNTDFYDVLAMGTTCPTGNAPVDNNLNGARRFNQNCIVTHLNAVKFNQLKVPYVDEFVIGFTQQLYDWSLVAKYIYRAGKDDIRYVRRDYANLPIDPSLTTHYFTFTNEGKS